MIDHFLRLAEQHMDIGYYVLLDVAEMASQLQQQCSCTFNASSDPAYPPCLMRVPPFQRPCLPFGFVPCLTSHRRIQYRLHKSLGVGTLSFTDVSYVKTHSKATLTTSESRLVLFSPYQKAGSWLCRLNISLVPTC